MANEDNSSIMSSDEMAAMGHLFNTYIDQITDF
jgi:hypothetical protein